jgi:MoaA/NifB/PqqE/SkfB family radical SAM enzyme
MGQLQAGSFENPVYKILTYLLFNNFTRKRLLSLSEIIVDYHLRPGRKNAFSSNSKRILQERKMMALSILKSMDRSIEHGSLTPRTVRRVLELWSNAVIKPRESSRIVRQFYSLNHCNPPWFLVISPGHACNLKCKDCYASSASNGAKLQWTMLNKIIREACELWDIKLIVFSGGEPFAYRSEGKGILDIVEQYPDILFLAFTNGTLIDSETASRIGSLGNITPAFSVEGMCPATDERRGEGTFDSVLHAMEYMRDAGTPFGISLTVNRENHLALLSDEFLDYFFEGQGAFYGFYFQYLPIGRNASFDLMPTPKQRLAFRQEMWKVIERKKLFLIDFWNHGTLANGCIAAGRDGGYLYIDWNGKVMPCVFTPYSVGSIYEMHRDNKDLNDLWKSALLQSVRHWQVAHGYGNTSLTADGNWLRPCPYRDHHKQFVHWLRKYQPEPEDESSREILSDPEYHRALFEYDQELAEIFDPLWKRQYMEEK